MLIIFLARIGAHDVIEYVGLYTLIGGIMFFAGLWSVQAGRSMFAAWPAILLSIGAVVFYVNHNTALNTWKKGEKWNIWTAEIFIGFLITIVLLMVYLIIRENHRLYRWRNGPRTTMASEEIRREESKARLSISGWLGMVFVACVLSVGVALISPYLWQTVPMDIEEGNGEYSREHTAEERKRKKEDCSNYSGCSPPPECVEQQNGQKKPKDPPEPFSAEQMEQTIEHVGQFLWLLFIILALLLVSYLSFGRPSKRLVAVRHFRDALWPISTTKEIENQWKLILIALADLGMENLQGSAQDIAERAIPILVKATGNDRRIPGLVEAAKIRDRVCYGLGVEPNDLETIKKHAQWVYESVWNRLNNKQQIVSLYRRKLW